VVLLYVMSTDESVLACWIANLAWTMFWISGFQMQPAAPVQEV